MTGHIAKVFYKEDGTYSEHNAGLGEIKLILHQNHWRKNDKVTFDDPKKGKQIGKISKVLPEEVTIQFKSKTNNVKLLHDDARLKKIKSSNLSERQGTGYRQYTCTEQIVEIKGQKMIVEHLQQQLEYVEPERKNETRALRRMFAAKRIEKDSKKTKESEAVSLDDIFSNGIQSIVECSENKLKMRLNALWPSEKTQEKQYWQSIMENQNQ